MHTLDADDIVLVVDDSPDALSLINDTLEQAGIGVLVALEGRQAITIAKRMQPDIILLDAMMPHMDGFETCTQLKSDPALANIPVIFMTGLTETENVVRGLEVGGVDYLTKPIRPDELLARMKVHLHNARLTNSAQQAIDSLGQKLFTTDASGKLLWATPQTHDLLAHSGLDEHWLKHSLVPSLNDWLVKKPVNGHRLELDQLSLPLSVVYVEKRNNNEHLLRLVDGSESSEEQKLKQHLGLTQREADVMVWIARGKTNREIGQILGISPRTVNKHLEQVFIKVDVDNRTAAASIALKVLAK